MTTMNSRISASHVKKFFGMMGGLVLGLVLAGSVQALRFEPADEFSIDIDTTLAYGAMWRVQGQDKSSLKPAFPLDELFASDTPGDNRYGESVTRWNGDDGNRNFDKGDMVSDRTAITTDMDFRFKKYGFFLRGQMFYDAVYFEETSWSAEGNDKWGTGAYATGHGCSAANMVSYGASTADNNPCGYMGPESINNVMADGEISDPSHFSQRARNSQGYKARFLDAYVYGTFPIGDHTLDLRLGRQALAWGEALLLQGGIGFAQNRISATAATSPGVELKEIFLPTGRLYGQLDLTESLTMEAYWQYEWLPSELFAAGTYFSPEDITGSDIILVNGAIGNCMFGLDEVYDTTATTPPGTLSNKKPCGSDPAYLGNIKGSSGSPNSDDGIGTAHWLQASSFRNYMSRAKDVEPDAKSDQYGLAFRKLLAGGSELGFYFVQYHDTLPSVWAGNNGAKDTLVPSLIPCSTGDMFCNPDYNGPLMSSSEVEGFNSSKYTVSYAERIKLWGLTYNTVVNDIQLGFELAYRENQPVVTACSEAQLAAVTFDADKVKTLQLNPSLPNLIAAGASMQSDCKDPSAKYYAETQGYDFFTGTGWDQVSAKLLAWPKPAEVFTYNMGATMVLPTTPFWDTAFFVGEIGGFYVGSGFKNEDLKQSSVGSFTQRGEGISFIFLPQYKNVLEGVDLTLPFFVNYGIEGSFAYFNYNEHALWYSVGAEAVYLSKMTVGMYYNAFSGSKNAWRDRDNISVNVKYTF